MVRRGEMENSLANKSMNMVVFFNGLPAVMPVLVQEYQMMVEFSSKWFRFPADCRWR